jgi:hypothetical protein
MPPIELDPRDLERQRIDFGLTSDDFEPRITEPAATLLADLGLPWPAGLEPTPQPLAIEPDPSDPLPRADVVAITWTVAEVEALADTLTPGFTRNNWYRYERRFESHYRPLIRPGAPAQKARRLASYFPTRIGTTSVLCMKSELHLNQDGIATGEGTATLPVADLFRQILDEVKPRLIITVGTAGATFEDHQLGDVMITRAAQFRLSQEFRNEPFAHSKYACDFPLPASRLDAAKTLLAVHEAKLVEPDFGPPTKAYPWTGGLIPGPRPKPDFKIDGRDFDAFLPMLTTDFFEFGNSKNELWKVGCGVEMGDAVLGMVVEERQAADLPVPRWLVIRNASDPQINGDLPDRPRAMNMQAHWAVWYYETYGYWTSVMSAIATWAMCAES